MVAIPKWDKAMRFGDAEVFIRRNVEFRSGDKTLTVGDHMRVERQLGNSGDVIIREEVGVRTVFRLSPKIVFHEGQIQPSIENFLCELSEEEQKQFLAIYEKFTK